MKVNEENTSGPVLSDAELGTVSINKFLQKAATVENLKQILDNSHNSVVCLDLNGSIIYWNSVSGDFFGFTEAEVIGKSWEVLFPENKSIILSKIAIATIEGRSSSNLEIRGRKKSGYWGETLVNIFPFKDHSCNVTACCLMITDISEMKIIEHEIKAFNIVVAHDYKETLQQLYTNLEYIITNDARNLSSTGKGNIRRAQSAIQRMHLLTDDINNYFKLYDLDVKLSRTDSSTILKNVLKEYQSKLEQYSAKVEFADLPVLLSNHELLCQLFTNLLDNAIKFRNLVVPLVITLKYIQTDEMHSINGPLKNTTYGIISVTDNGLGFSETEAEKIFEIFYRRKEGKERGTGIGLAICKRIMALHGGFIAAEAQPEIGATFNCYFPLVPVSE